jgi:quercetin dioxygenase-like cupin family protein
MSEIRVTGPDDGEAALSGPVVIAPHTEGPPQHRHAEHDEGFYVVSGTVRFTSGDTWFDAPAGMRVTEDVNVVVASSSVTACPGVPAETPIPADAVS